MAGGGLCEDREGGDTECATVLAGEGNGDAGAAEAGQGAAEDGDRVTEEQQPGIGGEVKGEVEEAEVTVREQALKKETEGVVAFIRQRVADGLLYEWVGSGVEMSRLDGMLVLGGELAYGVEVKWRRFGLKKLMGDYGGEMQMPADKLLAGQTFAYAFGVPTLLLYLLDDCLVAQTVVASNGDKMNVTRELYEQSNRTIEGGTIQRKNCYISIEGAEKIRIGL